MAMSLEISPFGRDTTLKYTLGNLNLDEEVNIESKVEQGAFFIESSLAYSDGQGDKVWKAMFLVSDKIVNTFCDYLRSLWTVNQIHSGLKFESIRTLAGYKKELIPRIYVCYLTFYPRSTKFLIIPFSTTISPPILKSLGMTRIVVCGNQSFCNGSINKASAQALVRKLNSNAPVGISFNAEAVEDTLTGGTCSAMSIEFALQYMLGKGLDVIQLSLATSSSDFRTQQMALNTINHKGNIKNNSVMQQRVAAIFKLKNIEVVSSSLPISYKQVDYFRRLDNILESLKNGVYVCRMLNFSKCAGHTMVYIKCNGYDFWYDPNQGVCSIPNVLRTIEIAKFLKEYSANEPFVGDSIRFYGLKLAPRV